MNKDFDNINRTRYYGVRVGDIVEVENFSHDKRPKVKGTVMAYGFMDNNKVWINTEGDITRGCVAEWCKIITKVEDRTDKFLSLTFLMIPDKKKGYREYEVSGFFNVKSANVPNDIKIGDFFNLYCKYGSKEGGIEWKGDLRTSLIESENYFQNNDSKKSATKIKSMENLLITVKQIIINSILENHSHYKWFQNKEDQDWYFALAVEIHGKLVGVEWSVKNNLNKPQISIEISAQSQDFFGATKYQNVPIELWNLIKQETKIWNEHSDKSKFTPLN